ncbi:MAG: hypothetical protein KKC19_01405 [Nanoarchaeota archaeon]|nr:hypothetical protein [Nanoarchaeota archaeon]
MEEEKYKTGRACLAFIPCEEEELARLGLGTCDARKTIVNPDCPEESCGPRCRWAGQYAERLKSAALTDGGLD